MTDWTTKENREVLARFAPLVGRLESLEFGSGARAILWGELAIVLAEECAGIDHARRVIDAFLRTPRFDEKGFEKLTVPAPPELRAFARKIPAHPMPDGDLPAPCEHCAPYDGRWRVAKTDANGQPLMGYCDCRRGKHLAAVRLASRGKSA